ncbi:MAG: hypothetical protein HOP29_08885 [Phycisphaerales bacterium]|nr:hypothetical protein [Phycisphaerales bacterium]
MAQQPPDPASFERYVGEVTANDVYLRSGPSANYYEVAKLSAGDRVTVVGRQETWLAIVPPNGCFSLVHKNFVDLDATGLNGVVNGDAVLVRAGSSLRSELYAKQVKLDRGAEVTVIGPHNQDYLRIAPPPGAELFLSSDYVARAPDQTAAPNANVASLPVAAMTGQPSTDQPSNQATDAATPAVAADAGTKPSPQPSAERSALTQLEDAMTAEMEKPLVQRDHAELLERYRSLAGKTADAYVKAYATTRIKQLELGAEAAVEVRTINDTADRLSAARRDKIAERANIRAPIREIGGGFDAEGELRNSALFSSPVGPKWYRLVSGIDDVTWRTLCYIEIPPDLTLDMNRYLGRKVGVRARERRLLTGEVDPVEVLVASELVILDAGVPAGENESTRNEPVRP